MTPEAQIVAIAEACEWTQIHNANTMAVGGIWCGYPPVSPIIGKPQRLPNYPEDLNACKEMEESLSRTHRDNQKGSQCHDYSGELWKLTAQKIDGVDGKGGTMFALAHATAPQRCEAFLRATGRWQD